MALSKKYTCFFELPKEITEIMCILAGAEIKTIAGQMTSNSLDKYSQFKQEDKGGI
jgi:hypothetical protein